MLISTNKREPIWSDANATDLGKLLSQDIFRKALLILAQKAPALLDGSDVNKTLVASGRVQGYSEALNALIEMASEVEEPRTENAPAEYPDLDAAAAWADVDKANGFTPTPNP